MNLFIIKNQLFLLSSPTTKVPFPKKTIKVPFSKEVPLLVKKKTIKKNYFLLLLLLHLLLLRLMDNPTTTNFLFPMIISQLLVQKTAINNIHFFLRLFLIIKELLALPCLSRKVNQPQPQN
jgi:hypothetical protein